MRSSTLLLALTLLLCSSAWSVNVNAQAPIPHRLPGFQIGGALKADTPIIMDVFFDLLCPDCADGWAAVKDIVDHYGSNIALAIHTFPLPYHTYGFMAAQSAHVVASKLGASAMRKYADFIFGAQSAFWNGPTSNMSSNDVLALLGKKVVDAGFLDQTAFQRGMADSNIQMETVVAWKYACSKGVLGTPTYFVNGVNVNGSPNWSLDDWRMLLDPLVNSRLTPKEQHDATPVPAMCEHRAYSQRMFMNAAGDCPPDRPACQYLPGKFECCTPGEACIPNVGCRC